MKLITRSALALICSLGLLVPGFSHAADAPDDTLWFQAPAPMPGQMHGGKPIETAINDALPIGAGMIGALVCGGVQDELLRLNEITLWTGGANPSGDYNQMGGYQALADLHIKLSGSAEFTDYRRSLDLGKSTAAVSYKAGGVSYSREYFASHPAGVIVGRLAASAPGTYSGSVELDDRHLGATSASGNRITISGTLSNGLQYEAQLLVRVTGGQAAAKDGRVEFNGCDSVELIFAAGTDYVMDPARQYRGQAPHAAVTARIDAAGKRTFADLYAQHASDYSTLFKRSTIDLGASTQAQRALPTDLRRLEGTKNPDPGLEALLYQYGRYLLISCSRPGGLPANLQGLWNDSNTPPWHCDYHTNINIQMNYWPSEPANLAECQLPLLDLVRSQLPAWREATRESPEMKPPSGALSTHGWAVRTSHNITGGMGWQWDKTANAWYCQHFWEHYAYGGDKDYLRAVAYPVMKETCEFWEDHLKTLPDGRLVVPNGWSPEHGPHEDGVNYNQEIVWDLFNNTVEAAGVLGVDNDFRTKLAAMRDHLAVPGVGSWGQLLEWMKEKKDQQELDTANDHHRHTSHLFGVYPGRQISLALTPALAKAALVSLKARGDTGDVREWSYAWRTALYARLGDPEAAHSQVMHFFGTTCPNLFGNHPPMQMDGNFGMTASIAEMLLQSQAGAIDLLPALPSAWKTGEVTGLRARGGLEITESWRNGALENARAWTDTGGKFLFRYGNKSIKVTIQPRVPMILVPASFGLKAAH